MEINKDKPTIVFYNLEKGCSHCEKMRPIVKEYIENYPEVEVHDVQLKSYDEVPEQFEKTLPLFVAYKDGEIVSVQYGSKSNLELAFTPEKLPPRLIPVERATMLQLISDEANITDQLQPMLTQLNKIKKEIKKRKDLIEGKSCCEGCATGGSCGGH